MKKNAVAIVFPDAFNSGYSGATNRIIRFAKSLKKIGLEPVLIAGKAVNDCAINIDQQFPGNVIRLPHSGKYYPFVEKSDLAKKATRCLWKIQGVENYENNLSCGWATKVEYNIVVKELKQRYRVISIVGISGGYLDGPIVAQKLSSELKVPWVYSHHDPPWNVFIGKPNPRLCKTYLKLINDSHCVIFNCAEMARALLRLSVINEDKIRVIYTPFTDDLLSIDKPCRDQHKKISVIYGGATDQSRSLDSILFGLNLACQIKPSIIKTIEIKLFLKSSEVKRYRQFVKQMGLNHVITVGEMLDQKEYLKVLRAADAMIVVQPEQYIYQIPGKIFEALSFGVSIWGFLPRTSEAGEILSASGLCQVCGTNNPVDIATFIINNTIRDQNTGAKTLNTKTSWYSQFTSESFDNGIREVFNSLSKSAKGQPL
jgi:glycosyltransferase involved in cell wall biosynthesis